MNVAAKTIAVRRIQHYDEWNEHKLKKPNWALWHVNELIGYLEHCHHPLFINLIIKWVFLVLFSLCCVSLACLASLHFVRCSLHSLVFKHSHTAAERRLLTMQSISNIDQLDIYFFYTHTHTQKQSKERNGRKIQTNERNVSSDWRQRRRRLVKRWKKRKRKRTP